MKPIEVTDQYIGTSQAAKILGLSIGTVQKLVDAGVFSSFLTDGKHRRIQIQSLREYCHRNRMPTLALDTNDQHMQLAVAPFELENLASNYQNNENIEWVRSPFDLISLPANVPFLIVDARLEWLSWDNLKNYAFDKFKGNIIITSADHCPAWVHEKFANKLTFTRQDLSAPLIDSLILVTAITPKQDFPTHQGKARRQVQAGQFN